MAHDLHAPYVAYVPPWLDPKWEDDGPQRRGSVWEIRDGLLDQVRPAMLPKDEAHGPTPYAQRFGIFPGRTDGRSRTSPTRSRSRPVSGSGNVQTGADLIAHFTRITGRHGQMLDDFMTSTRPDLQNLDEVGRAYIQAYQDLLLDEQWQGIVFGQLTSQELLDKNYLTLGDAFQNLTGPLHRYMERERWVDTRLLGGQASETRPLFIRNGVTQEYDPLTNNLVWAALQPALQLVTRLLQARDPLSTAVADVTQRVRINEFAIPGPQIGYRANPKFKVTTMPPLLDENWSENARGLSNIPGFSAPEMSFLVLDRLLKLRIGTNHVGTDGTFLRRPGISGYTSTHNKLSPDAPIIITIAAELVWPLLVGTFSKSEKMMASYIIATTITHEMMHALEYAHYKWLRNPRSFGVTDQRVVDLAHQYYRELCPETLPEREPHFEDDAFAELGHAYESHILGGGTWPFGEIGGPMLLSDNPCILVRSKWPDGVIHGHADLGHPRARTDRMYSFVCIDQVQKVFRNEFWQTDVPRYGMAAMRDPRPKPDLVCYQQDQSNTALRDFLSLDLGTRPDRDWIVNYIGNLDGRNRNTLATYVRTLAFDCCRFSLMLKRFDENRGSENTAYNELAQHVSSLFLSIHELRAWMLYQSPLDNEAKSEMLHVEYSLWQRRVDAGAPLDDHSVGFVGTQGYSYDTFLDGVRNFDSIARLSQKVISKLMNVGDLLDQDLKRQENMVCELYQFPTEYWSLYNTQRPDHRLRWMERCRNNTGTAMSITSLLGGFGLSPPFWDNEWKARVQSWATNFGEVLKLIEVDDSSVHANWRDMLTTVPMLRKARRTPREQLFFLAKREMLGLTGGDLEMMTEFKTRFRQLLALGPHRVVLPQSDPDETKLAILWAGILDPEVQNANRGRNIFEALNSEARRKFMDELRKEEEAFRLSNYVRAANQVVPDVIQGMAPPSGPGVLPQHGRFRMMNHPQPLGSLQQGHPPAGEPGRGGLAQRYSFGPNTTQNLMAASNNMLANQATNWQQRQEASRTAHQNLHGMIDTLAQAQAALRSLQNQPPQLPPPQNQGDDSSDGSSILLARQSPQSDSSSDSETDISEWKFSRPSSYTTADESDSNFGSDSNSGSESDSGVDTDGDIARGKGLKRKAFGPGWKLPEQTVRVKKRRKT